MNKKGIKEEINAIVRKDIAKGTGKVPFGWNGKRVARVADIACREHTGDIVEIGAYKGRTTAELLKVANRYDRNVIVIDPWKKGTQNCVGGEYEEFLHNTRHWHNRLIVHRMRSDDPQLKNWIPAMRLAFAFVDGLHTFEMCYHDIMLVGQAGIICVDDINRKKWKLLDALAKAAINLDRCEVTNLAVNAREGYIL